MSDMDTVPVQRAPIDIQMSYHENSVEFTGPNSVRGFRFTVNEFFITSGQDPDGKNKVGDVKTIVNKDHGWMNFVVGRKGNSSVASWWRQRFWASDSTFNDNPDELNFAFRGTLEIDVLGNGITTRYSIENVGLAQGHTGQSNNWWFAAKGAQPWGTDTISVVGSAASGGKAAFVFRRGFAVGTAVSTVTLATITKV